MENSDFLIQRISEAVEKISPLTRLNYLVPGILALVAVLFAYPDINSTIKSGVATGMLISLVVVMNYLPRRLEQSTKALLKIQSEIFFARRKIDLMNEEHIHQLLGILQKLEGSEKRNGTSIATLESNALELIKM